MVKIKWSSYFGRTSGYAEAARQYCVALKRLGADIICDSMDNSYLSDMAWMAATSKVKDDGYFPVMHDIPGAMSRGYFTVFELEKAPAEWERPLRKAEVVMTPSEFARNSLGHVCDINKIHVVHHGVAENFSPSGASVKFDASDHRPLPTFKFLSVFEWVERKCGDRLIEAFQKEFSPDEDVGLFIKTSAYRRLPLLVNKVTPNNIFIVDGFVEDMAKLYGACDAYVCCAGGEGWGETLSEAMACGLPTIGSNHSGNLEFMNDENSFLVDVEDWQPIGYNSLMPMIAPWERQKPPKVESIQKAMRTVFEGGDDVKRRARKGTRVSSDFTWEKAAKKIIDIVEAVQRV